MVKMGFFNKGMYYNQMFFSARQYIKLGQKEEANKLINKVLSELTGVIILAYHEIGYYDNQYSITPEAFQKQLQLIKDLGIEVITYEKIRTNDVDYGKMNAIISFDDGRMGVKKYADDILRQYGYPYMLFLTPGYQNEPDNILEKECFSEFMTWSDIEYLLSKERASLGAHTYSHKNLFMLEKEKIIDELEKCNREIEAHFSIVVKDFAYPYGKYGDIAEKEVREIYKTASTTNVGINNSDTSVLKLRRTVVLKMFNEKNFKKIIYPEEVREKFEYLRNQCI